MMSYTLVFLPLQNNKVLDLLFNFVCTVHEIMTPEFVVVVLDQLNKSD